MLVRIADNLDSAHSPWDGESVDCEDAFFATMSIAAETIRSETKRMLCSKVYPQDDAVGQVESIKPVS